MRTVARTLLCREEEVQAETGTVMATTRSVTGAVKVVKPIFSRDLGEAKRRVRELYRAWYREVPTAGKTVCCGGETVLKKAAGASRSCLVLW